MASELPINPLPGSNASFLATLLTFLEEEDADRYIKQFSGFVFAGGTHGTGASLTGTPSALTAFPGGFYITETASITYANNTTTYVVASHLTTGDIGTFTRVSGTHYLTMQSGTKPSLPSNCVWLMQVITVSGSIASVTDLRTRVPYMDTYLYAELPAASKRGRLAHVSDIGSGGAVYVDNGSTWLQIGNPMTAVADMIVGGSDGAGVRLPKGTGNQVLGMNSGASAQEYKSLVAGTGITITNSPGAVTIQNSSTLLPTGAVLPFYSTVVPSGWLLCNGADYDADTYPELFLIYITYASRWGYGPAVGTFTASATTDELTSVAHGLSNGELIHVGTSTTLPAGLADNVAYYVINATADTLQVSLTAGGSAVDITSTGSGTHTLYDRFVVPDLRGRTVIGQGTGTAFDSGGNAEVDTATSRLTVPTNNSKWQTGMAVVFTLSSGSITGLVSGTTYYVIRISSTQIQLAATLGDSQYGTAISLTAKSSPEWTITHTLTGRSQAFVGGRETHAMTATELVAHSHGLADSAGLGGLASSHIYVDAGTQLSDTRVTGGNVAANIMNPFLVLTYIIKT